MFIKFILRICYLVLLTFINLIALALRKPVYLFLFFYIYIKTVPIVVKSNQSRYLHFFYWYHSKKII